MYYILCIVGFCLKSLSLYFDDTFIFWWHIFFWWHFFSASFIFWWHFYILRTKVSSKYKSVIKKNMSSKYKSVIKCYYLPSCSKKNWQVGKLGRNTFFETSFFFVKKTLIKMHAVPAKFIFHFIFSKKKLLFCTAFEYLVSTTRNTVRKYTVADQVVWILTIFDQKIEFFSTSENIVPTWTIVPTCVFAQKLKKIVPTWTIVPTWNVPTWTPWL